MSRSNDYWMTDADAQKAAAFAPGISNRNEMGSPEMLEQGSMVPYVVQEHLARHSGRHFDIRAGKDKMLSWATKKELPKPGGKSIALFPQPLHDESYSRFQGTIKGGYGQGVVRQADFGKALITHASPNKIKFTVAHHQMPEDFTLVRMAEKPGRKPAWLMMNTTPTETIPYKKEHYKKIPAEQIDKLMDPNYVMSAKIDGASSFLKLMKDKVDVLSYRTSKKTGGPIVHTHRMGLAGQRFDIPKELQDTTLRGEVYGTRDNKTIPAAELGGLLNSSVVNSLDAQQKKNIKMRMALFGANQVGGQPWEGRTHDETRKIIQGALKWLPKETFSEPPYATTPEEKKRMWKSITGAKHPLTREGVVGFDVSGKTPPLKVKPVNDYDVHIRELFDQIKGKLKGKTSGGFRYSTTPQGKIQGEVGTGFDAAERKQMFEHPEEYVGRVARIQSPEQFPSGAYRAPVYIARHEDYPEKTAAWPKIQKAYGDIGTGLKDMYNTMSAKTLGATANAQLKTDIAKGQQARQTRLSYEMANAPQVTSPVKIGSIIEDIDPSINSEHRRFVAVDSDGNKMGSVIAQRKPRSPNKVEISNLHVEPSKRGQGVARALINRVKDTHKDATLSLNVKAFDGSNDNMLRDMYTHMGFKSSADREMLMKTADYKSAMFKYGLEASTDQLVHRSTVPAVLQPKKSKVPRWLKVLGIVAGAGVGVTGGAYLFDQLMRNKSIKNWGKSTEGIVDPALIDNPDLRGVLSWFGDQPYDAAAALTGGIGAAAGAAGAGLVNYLKRPVRRKDWQQMPVERREQLLNDARKRKYRNYAIGLLGGGALGYGGLKALRKGIGRVVTNSMIPIGYYGDKDAVPWSNASIAWMKVNPGAAFRAAITNKPVTLEQVLPYKNMLERQLGGTGGSENMDMSKFMAAVRRPAMQKFFDLPVDNTSYYKDSPTNSKFLIANMENPALRKDFLDDIIKDRPTYDRLLTADKIKSHAAVERTTKGNDIPTTTLFGGYQPSIRGKNIVISDAWDFDRKPDVYPLERGFNKVNLGRDLMTFIGRPPIIHAEIPVKDIEQTLNSYGMGGTGSESMPSN